MGKKINNETRKIFLDGYSSCRKRNLNTSETKMSDISLSIREKKRY
jgi:hypothetical protein